MDTGFSMVTGPGQGSEVFLWTRLDKMLNISQLYKIKGVKTMFLHFVEKMPNNPKNGLASMRVASKTMNNRI